jgi:hypothetical protein
MNGMCLADFKTHAEALKTADELIAINKAEYGHAGDKVEHEMPLLSRFFFFTSGAREKNARSRKWNRKSCPEASMSKA